MPEPCQNPAEPSVRLSHGDRAVVAGVFLAALLAFWSTAAPDIVAEGDCSEYVAAASVAGIPHAPGYPTYMLLASGLARLVSAEHLARALNLMSAFFGALTAGLVAWIALRLARRAFPGAGPWGGRGAALGAGLLLAVATEFWNQSLSAEVYTLSTALLALCLERRSASAGPARWPVAALAAGLAVGVHYNVGLPCALLVAAGIAANRRQLAWRGCARAAGAFALGLATFLYLPLRSSADPLLDFGDPETPERFWRLLTLADMPSGRVVARELARLGQQIAAVAGLAAKQWPPWVFVLCAAGLVTCACRRTLRSTGIALVSILVLDYAGILVMANFEPVDEEIYELRFLFLPAYLALALYGGLGLAAAAALLERRARQAAPVLLAVLALALAPWTVAQARRLDKSGDRVMFDYGLALVSVPEGPAVLFTYGDNAWMPLRYLQVVWQMRRDVTVIAAGLLRNPWYRDQLVERCPGLVLDETAPGVLGTARANAARVNLYHADPEPHGLRGFQEVPSGVLMRIVPAGELVRPLVPPEPSFSPRYAELDMRERSVRADVLQAYVRTALWCRANGHPLDAERAFGCGSRLVFPVPRMEEFHLARAGLLLERGSLQASLGKLQEARISWSSARDEAPGSLPAGLAAERLAALVGGAGSPSRP